MLKILLVRKILFFLSHIFTDLYFMINLKQIVNEKTISLIHYMLKYKYDLHKASLTCLNSKPRVDNYCRSFFISSSLLKS